MSEKSRVIRLPLRDLLNHTEHRCRELIEHLQMDALPTAAELHRLTRPNRKKSSYPSMRSVCNLYERVRRSAEYSSKVSQRIDECLHAIDERMQEKEG
jgi:hypothetical protein